MIRIDTRRSKTTTRAAWRQRTNYPRVGKRTAAGASLAILEVLSSITSSTESESTATPTPTKAAAKSQRHLVRIPDNGKRRGTLA